MTDSFWVGGSEAYADALSKKYEPQLKELRKLHNNAEDGNRAELAAEIQRVEADYQTKQDSIDRSLF